MGTLYGMLVAIGVSLLSIGGITATAVYQLSLAHEAEYLEDMATLEVEVSRRSPLTPNGKSGDAPRVLPAA